MSDVNNQYAFMEIICYGDQKNYTIKISKNIMIHRAEILCYNLYFRL